MLILHILRETWCSSQEKWNNFFVIIIRSKDLFRRLTVHAILYNSNFIWMGWPQIIMLNVLSSSVDIWKVKVPWEEGSSWRCGKAGKGTSIPSSWHKSRSWQHVLVTQMLWKPETKGSLEHFRDQFYFRFNDRTSLTENCKEL